MLLQTDSAAWHTHDTRMAHTWHTHGTRMAHGLVAMVTHAPRTEEDLCQVVGTTADQLALQIPTVNTATVCVSRASMLHSGWSIHVGATSTDAHTVAWLDTGGCRRYG